MVAGVIVRGTAAVLVLGGGLAACAATHQPAPQVAMSATAAPSKPAKAKKHKTKSKKSSTRGSHKSGG